MRANVNRLELVGVQDNCYDDFDLMAQEARGWDIHYQQVGHRHLFRTNDAGHFELTSARQGAMVYMCAGAQRLPTSPCLCQLAKTLPSRPMAGQISSSRQSTRRKSSTGCKRAVERMVSTRRNSSNPVQSLAKN